MHPEIVLKLLTEIPKKKKYNNLIPYEVHLSRDMLLCVIRDDVKGIVCRNKDFNYTLGKYRIIENPDLYGMKGKLIFYDNIKKKGVSLNFAPINIMETSDGKGRRS